MWKFFYADDDWKHCLKNTTQRGLRNLRKDIVITSAGVWGGKEDFTGYLNNNDHFVLFLYSNADLVVPRSHKEDEYVWFDISEYDWIQNLFIVM